MFWSLVSPMPLVDRSSKRYAMFDVEVTALSLLQTNAYDEECTRQMSIGDLA